MLGIFERYFELIRKARTDADMLAVLKSTSIEFGLRDSFLIEYDNVVGSRNFLLDTRPDRASWWESSHYRVFEELPADLRSRLDSEALVHLDQQSMPAEPAAARDLREKFDLAEVTVIPIRSEGVVVGVVGFSGIVQLTAMQSMALQMIAINLFAQMRSLRNLAFRATPNSLTKREREVLSLSAEGLTSRQIAIRLGMSARTVNQHVDNVADKLGTRNRAHTVAEVIRHGLLN